MHEQITAILADRRLAILFQPIIDCSRRCVFGYEALVRGPADTVLHAPIKLFDAAAQAGRLTELDLLCRELAIRKFVELGLPGRLFINVNPAVLLLPDYNGGHTLNMVGRTGLDPQRVVVEITEQTPIDDYGLVRKALRHYHDAGFSVALDDLGAGYAGLRHWSELHVDYLKIDRSFVSEVDRNEKKQSFLRSISRMARDLGSRIIAEGVETEGEYHALWRMGLDLAQGYFFARPRDVPPRHLPDLLPSLKPNGPSAHGPASPAVGGLAEPGQTIYSDEPCEKAVDLFSDDPQSMMIPVIGPRRRLEGVIWRDEFLVRMAHPYGHALYARRPVNHFVTGNYFAARETETLEDLSRRLTETPDLTRKGSFVILDADGRYKGSASLIGLLREITELQVAHARYANPLTGLPGNVPIQRKIEGLLERGERFALAYLDLDNFKAVNDVHGHATGDDIISCTAEIILQCTNPGRDFIGHIGGDDFVIIFESPDWKARCQEMCALFDERARWFYESAEREAGGVTIRDRRGEEYFCPLVTLSIGIVPVDDGTGTTLNYHRLAEAAAEVKKHAKRMSGSKVFVDRRRRGSA